MDIRKLMEEATPLPWDARHIYEEKDWDLSIAAVNALPAVLELMEAIEPMLHGDGHLRNVVAKRDALAKALGAA